MQPNLPDLDLDLDRAWRQVASDARRDKIPDIVYFVDFVDEWPRLREEIRVDISSRRYAPDPPQVIETAKTSLLTRPLAQLGVKDRVVYQALIDKLAPTIDAALSDGVFSARLSKSGHVSRHGSKRWVQFQQAARELYETNAYSFMLSTDVISYFEYIDIGILTADLHNLSATNRPYIDLLSHFLSSIEANSSVWGLPQGSVASAVLGNYYLLPADQALGMHDVQYVRYQDDYRVFSKDQHELRSALQDVVKVLRSRRLNLGASKTRILVEDEITADLDDMRKTAIEYGFRIGDRTVVAQLRRMFDDATRDVNDLRERDIRFTVYRFQRLGDDYAVDWILKHL